MRTFKLQSARVLALASCLTALLSFESALAGPCFSRAKDEVPQTRSANHHQAQAAQGRGFAQLAGDLVQAFEEQEQQEEQTQQVVVLMLERLLRR